MQLADVATNFCYIFNLYLVSLACSCIKFINKSTNYAWSRHDSYSLVTRPTYIGWLHLQGIHSQHAPFWFSKCACCVSFHICCICSSLI